MGKKYYYDPDTEHLCVNEDFSQPFLCPSEAEPLRFRNSAECLEYLNKEGIEGSVLYKLTNTRGRGIKW